MQTPSFKHAFLEINTKAIENNFNYFKSVISPDTKIMAMVKANAYGLGAVQVSNILTNLGVDYLGVAFSSEAIELRQQGITKPILIMNTDHHSFQELVQNNIEPTLYNEELINLFGREIESIDSIEEYPIHIKINSGMNRLGFPPKEAQDVLRFLSKYPKLKVKSIYSHFAVSDVENEEEFTNHQTNVFLSAAKEISEGLGYKPIWHISNSAGATNFPNANLNMVRVGIGLHGFSTFDEHKKNLTPVASLKTFISQINHLETGESVSYGRKFIANKPTKIATISIGYGDGVPRLLGNSNGRVSINGTLAPIIGVICMDMLMIDISNIECKIGDEVTIFGENPRLEDVAKQANTITYEILTSISPRVERIYI